MASYIGKPLFDSATAMGEKLAFTRCFVEVSASEHLPEEVTLEIQDNTCENSCGI